MKIHDFKAFIIKLFNFTYNKCTLFVQNDINFAYENMSGSEFLLVYKNKAHTIFFFLILPISFIVWQQKKKNSIRGGRGETSIKINGRWLKNRDKEWSEKYVKQPVILPKL